MSGDKNIGFISLKLGLSRKLPKTIYKNKKNKKKFCGRKELNSTHKIRNYLFS